jgi:X-Pro dipeptidyl-peptidase
MNRAGGDMRRVTTRAGVLAALILFLGAGTALAAPPYTSVKETYIVPTRPGDIYVEVTRPVDNGQLVRGPAILTYSPYSVLGRGGYGDVSRGYVKIFADVVGTGNSGGCYDYGGDGEKQSGYDLVEWIARQPWSTGKVGMTGGSYNGTTAIAAAVTRPPHLTTVVPEAAISRWYEYAFSGGIRYLDNTENPADEGFDTPLAFDFGLAVPPPIDAQDPTWADRVASTVRVCDEVEHTMHGYDFDTPDYDAFWQERDFVQSAGSVKIPVLLAYNWGDWNVKQEESVNFFRALKTSSSRHLYAGTRYSGHGTPGGGYAAAKTAWFDHYLMGISNGANLMPTVTSQTSTYDAAAEWNAGPWPKTTAVTLSAQEDKTDPDYRWKLLPAFTTPAAPTAATFVSTGANTESVANANPRTNQAWLWFESPALTTDVRIFGEVKVTLWSTIARRWITYTPTIVDIDPAKRLIGPGTLLAQDDRGLISVTRGWLDTRYRNSLKSQELVTPGTSFSTVVVTKPTDYTFKAGHLIGLQVQTEIAEWSVPKPADPSCTSPTCNVVRIDWEGGQTRVVLPIVGSVSKPSKLFAAQ